MGNDTLLILEDEDLVRRNLEAYFQDEGYSVCSACSGEEALQLLDTCKPQFAIVDMRLPGISGDEFIRSARKHCPKLQCLIYTAVASYELSNDLRMLGMTSKDVFSKPIHDMDIFAGRLTEIKDQHFH